MSSVRSTRTIVVLWSVAAALAVNAGCHLPKPPTMNGLTTTWPWRGKDKSRTGTPVRIVSTWTDTVFHQAGQKPQRGFGGRLVFYDRDDKEPILVNGQLVVYAFDETDRDLLDNKPTRRYVFPADQIPHHMSMTEIGASYSFWLPWDEAGGPRTEVSLICRFEPNAGAVITSEQTRHLLPGSIDLKSVQAGKRPPAVPEGVPHRPALPTLQSMQQSRQPSQDHGEVRLANFESPADAHTPVPLGQVEMTITEPERRMSVTSIALPSSLQLRAAAAHGAPQNGSQSAPQIQPPAPVQPPPVKAPAGPPATPTIPAAGTTRNSAASSPGGTGFGNWPIARPQFLSTQPLTWQPLAGQPHATSAGAWNTTPAVKNPAPQPATGP